MNADEIVKELRESLPPKIDYAELVGAEGFARGACYVWEDPLPYLMSNAADLLESQQARITELEAQLLESQRRERAAVKKAISWGVDLIEFNSDAHVTFCAECGFPIADYGVGKEISCTMCKAQNPSHNYVVTGPGSCRTTAERKAKIYDRLFGRGHQEAGKGVNDGEK